MSSGYKPTCELRVAIWNFGDQQVQRVQQRWESDYTGEEPEWRNVAYWYMAPGTPVDAASYPT